MQEPSTCARRVRFGVFEVDLRSGELRKAGSRIALQEQPFRILVRLLEHPGGLVTREELRQELWPADTFVDFDHGLNAAIKRLRDALGDSADTLRFIETMPRRGYRFIAPVQSETTLRESNVSCAARARRAADVRKLALVGAAVALVVAPPAGWWALHRPAPPDPPTIRSLAVLPLRNLTGDPSQEWLTDGLTEALSGAFSRLGSLTVVSSTSTLRYKNSSKPAREIGRELGHVDAIVEGSVSRSHGRLRVTLSAVHTATDRRLWVGSYERELDDVLALYSEIALAAAQELSVAVTSRERLRVAHSPDREAYE